MITTGLTLMDVDTELKRAIAYQTLAWSMVYPTAERLAGLREWQTSFAETFAELGLATAEVTSALNLLLEDEIDRLQTLQVEYTRLFINAIPSVPAPPYASAYTETGLLMGQPAEAALRAYRQAGLAFSTSTHDLPDHLAVELEFMFYLARAELAACERADEPQAGLLQRQQRYFLKDQLLPWVSTWQKRVDEADRIGFYRALARLIDTWLRTDAAYLDRHGG